MSSEQILLGKQAMLGAVALAFSLVAAGPQILAQEGVDEDPVIGIVDGAKIYRSQLQEHMWALSEQIRGAPMEKKKIYMSLLEHMVWMKLAAKAGREQGIGEGEDYDRRLAYHSDRLVKDRFFTRQLESEITEAAIQTAYDERIGAQVGEDEIQARHILVEQKQEAEAAIADLAQGADFAELAKQRSVGPSAQRGGDLGYFTAEDMVPAFSKAAYALEVGETSQRPVQTRFGWHVIKLEDRRPATPPSLEDLRPEIYRELFDAIYNRLFRDMMNAAEIELFAPDGGPLETGAETAQ